ncbi:YchJ family protein [Zhongshania marina]|jgi:SEC-C motif-containing protein|uniref:YchJ-like middle NTF2-like domain-containing protein n=1 Tax=Zhongshania marina TaxID=2304603 RepID=A0A2S4HI43_9GAMM|nr:YchJ family metal-binding protein [Marortus luteolus]POP53656.1 hypothetical protein C0068_05130 [Marortus luteolus]
MSSVAPTCHCGSENAFIDCCDRYLSGAESAPTAEALMRSRYSAFCLRNPDYLLATLQKDIRAKETRKALLKSFAGTQWRQLKVIRCQRGLLGDKAGEVEFAAFFTQDDEGGQLHERSRFVFEDERWFYVDGDILPPISLSRNEPCWCGSGRKLKKCHLA